MAKKKNLHLTALRSHCAVTKLRHVAKLVEKKLVSAQQVRIPLRGTSDKKNIPTDTRNSCCREVTGIQETIFEFALIELIGDNPTRQCLLHKLRRP